MNLRIDYDWTEGILNALSDPDEGWLNHVSPQEKRLYLILSYTMYPALIMGIIAIIILFVMRRLYGWMIIIGIANLLAAGTKQQYRMFLKKKYQFG